jgi:hypothetical protein
MLVVNCRTKDASTITRVPRKLQNVRFMAKSTEDFVYRRMVGKCDGKRGENP